MTELQPPDLLRLGEEHVRRQQMVVDGHDSKDADKWFKKQLISKLEKQFNRKIENVPQSKLPFLVRQSLTGGLALLRQAESLKANAARRKKEVEHRRFDRGFSTTSTQGFVETLKGKYINAVRGWRVAFQDDVLEHIGFQQFLIGCRRIGYTGNIKSLWNLLVSQPDPSMGVNNTGTVAVAAQRQVSNKNATSSQLALQNKRQTISYFDVDPTGVRKLHSFACMVEETGKEEGGLDFARLWNKYANAGGAMRYEMFYEFFCNCAETFNRNRTAAKFQRGSGGARVEEEGGGQDSLQHHSDDEHEENINQQMSAAFLEDPNLVPLTDPKLDSKVIFGALNFEYDCVIATDEFMYLLKFLQLKRHKHKEPHNLHAFRRTESLQMRRKKEKDWYLESQFKKMNFFVHKVDDFLAASLKKQFQQLLETRCGSVTIGWRVYLDPESQGFISYGEFLAGCRRLGISENLYLIWCDVLGIQHMEDIAKGLPPNANKHKHKEQMSPTEKLKTMLASPLPVRNVQPDLSPRMRNCGSSMSPSRLRQLPHLNGTGTTSANDDKMKSPNSSPRSFSPSPPGSPPKLSDLMYQLKSKHSPLDSIEFSSKHGSSSQFWLGVDIKSNDFRKRKRYLDKHNKALSLMLYHLDEEADFLLTRLSELIREYSLEDVWTVLDPNNFVSISSKEFQHQCRELGFTKLEGKRLFEALDVHASDLLTVEELQFLEKWNFPREQEEQDVARGNVTQHCYKYTQQRHIKQRRRNIHMTYLNLQESKHKNVLATYSKEVSSPTAISQTKSPFTERQLELRKNSMLQD